MGSRKVPKRVNKGLDDNAAALSSAVLLFGIRIDITGSLKTVLKHYLKTD